MPTYSRKQFSLPPRFNLKVQDTLLKPGKFQKKFIFEHSQLNLIRINHEKKSNRRKQYTTATAT